MRKYIFYAALFLIIAITTQCNKTNVDPDGLPPETQTGAGTFACKINGVVWGYNNPDPQALDNRVKSSWSFDANDKNGTLQVIALKYYDASKNYDEVIHFIADSLNLVKEKYLNRNAFNYGFVYTVFAPKNKQCGDYNSTGINDTTKVFSNSGKLIITKLDQNAKIISGTFYCTILETGCDTLKITDGRFDLKY